MLKKTLLCGLLLSSVATGAFAQDAAAPAAPAAEAAPPASPLTGNMGFFSQYVFRGLTQTNAKPALQGGFDYAHPSGLYVGTWASNISWLSDSSSYSSGGSLEWDLYGGYRGNIGSSELTYDAGLLQYYYPGSVATGGVKADTLEGYGALGWKFITAKYSYSMQNNTFGVTNSRGTSYFDISANVPLGESGFTANLHYGKQTYSGKTGTTSNSNLYSYSDYKIGLTYALPKDFSVGAFYTGTTGAKTAGYTTPYPSNIAKGTGTVFVSKTF